MMRLFAIISLNNNDCEVEIMAGRKRPTERELVNRQINYTIMKHLWRMREDKAANMPAFFEYIYMDKNKFGSIVRKDPFRKPELGKTAEILSKESGVPADIFTGKAVFTVNGLIRSQWEEYFKNVDNSLHTEDLEEKAEAKNNCKRFERLLRKMLLHIPIDRSVDINLYNAYVYLFEGRKTDGSDKSVKVNRLIKDLEGMSFAYMNDLTSEELIEYEKELQKQLEMVMAINNYRKFENK